MNNNLYMRGDGTIMRKSLLQRAKEYFWLILGLILYFFESMFKEKTRQNESYSTLNRTVHKGNSKKGWNDNSRRKFTTLSDSKSNDISFSSCKSCKE